MTRIYEVNFAHVRHGSNYSREEVAVQGFAEQAIIKAKRIHTHWHNGDKGKLRVESVRLLASGA